MRAPTAHRRSRPGAPQRPVTVTPRTAAPNRGLGTSVHLTPLQCSNSGVPQANLDRLLFTPATHTSPPDTTTTLVVRFRDLVTSARRLVTRRHLSAVCDHPDFVSRNAMDVQEVAIGALPGDVRYPSTYSPSAASQRAASTGSHSHTAQACWKADRAKSTAASCGSGLATTCVRPRLGGSPDPPLSADHPAKGGSR